MNKTFQEIGAEIGELVAAKAAAYGDSMSKVDAMMGILYPTGITAAQMPRALRLVRSLDKVCRYATDNDPAGESPLIDLAGYCIQGIYSEQKESAQECTSGNASSKDVKESLPETPASAAPSASASTTTHASARTAFDSTRPSTRPCRESSPTLSGEGQLALWSGRNHHGFCAACGERFGNRILKHVEVDMKVFTLHSVCSLGDLLDFSPKQVKP